MDIDFVIQDTFALVRPQWKLATTFEEAGHAFADLTKQSYKDRDTGKSVGAELLDDEALSEDEEDHDDDDMQELVARSSDDEAETEVRWNVTVQNDVLAG